MRRSPHDREILSLALPALGALAAEPLYLLVDTAMVGHLGTPQLAALALAAVVLSAVVALCIFLTYGTTAQVARLHGAGEDARAGAYAAQSLWLALGTGLLVAAAVAALAGPVIALLGGGGEIGALAERYLRLSAIGLPCALVALAGQGFLRGVGDLRTPLLVVVAGNLANVALNALLIYGLGWGLDGSAIATVVAQLAMGAAFVVLLLRAGARLGAHGRRPHAALMRPLVRMGGDLIVRTAALLAAFTTASAVLARVGAPSLGAHQICFQLFIFLALVLDAIAIAGQVLVGRMLGAGRPGDAAAAARRMLWWSLVAGCVFALALLALGEVVPPLFTDDPRVLERAGEVWVMFAAMQPAAALVFALDGVLIGAGDTRFLAAGMVVAGLGVYVPIALAALAFGWGIVGVWSGLLALMAVRLAANAARFAGGRWAVVGAPA